MQPPPFAARRALPSLVALAALAAAGAPRAADPSPPGDAEVRRFVVAVRYAAIYKAMAAGMVARAGEPVNAEDAKFQRLMRRVADQPEDAFVPVFTAVFARTVTPGDAKEIADFFESPLGRKVTQLSVARAQSGASAQAAVKGVTLTEQEKAAYQRFVATDAYKRYASLVTSRELATALMAEIARMPAFADLGLTVPASAGR